jgi:4-amino-4-deoxychorismate lyase
MLIETIKIESGHIHNIAWHNQRFNRSRAALWGIHDPINLQEHITPPPQQGVFRCRILYEREIDSIEYIPYQPKRFKTFQILQSNLDYNYKYADRTLLEKLKTEGFPYDEIIIEKDGLLTDTSIANIAFFDQNGWITPKKPLLRGTLREKLLNEGFLEEKKINRESLKHFSHFALMNAMIGFQIQNNITIYIDKKEKLCL